MHVRPPMINARYPSPNELVAKFDTHLIVTHCWIKKKMMPFKTMKLESHGSKGRDNLMRLIFCTPQGLIHIFRSSTSPMIHIALAPQDRWCSWEVIEKDALGFFINLNLFKCLYLNVTDNTQSTCMRNDLQLQKCPLIDNESNLKMRPLINKIIIEGSRKQCNDSWLS